MPWYSIPEATYSNLGPHRPQSVYFIFLHVKTYSCKDARAAIPKPGEENRKKDAVFQISKVGYSLQASYVPDGLYITQQPHLIFTAAESMCQFFHFTIKDI